MSGGLLKIPKSGVNQAKGKAGVCTCLLLTLHSFCSCSGLQDCMASCPIYTKSQESHPYLKGNVIQDVTISTITRKKSFVNPSGDVPLGITNTALGLRDDSLSHITERSAPHTEGPGWGINPRKHQGDLTQHERAAPLLPRQLQTLCYGMCISHTLGMAQPVPRSSSKNNKTQHGQLQTEVRGVQLRGRFAGPEPAARGELPCKLPPLLGVLSASLAAWWGMLCFHVFLCPQWVSAINSHNILTTEEERKIFFG